MGLTTLRLAIEGQPRQIEIKSSAIGCFYDIRMDHFFLRAKLSGRTVEESQQNSNDQKYTLIPYCLILYEGDTGPLRHLIVYQNRIWTIYFDSVSLVTGSIAEEFEPEAAKELERAIIQRST